ncbi:MAG: hypothetical protein ACR2MP_14940 [Streptosporangiaceae bacterium]
MTAAAAGQRPPRISLGTWVTALAGLLVLTTAGMLALAVLSHQEFNSLVSLAVGVPSGIVGLLAAQRQPRNPLGWLLIAVALCLTVGTDGPDYAILRYSLGYHLPFGVPAVWADQIWGPGLELLGLVVLLFPDGKLSSAWWRGALWAYTGLYLLGIVILIVATAQAVTGHHISLDSNGSLIAMNHPPAWYSAISGPQSVLLLLLIVAFVARQALSWRRSSGERRQQLKWLASGAVVTIACALLTTSGSGTSTSFSVWHLLAALPWFGFAALPLSIGVGILKYRLYDIDRIISRTLAYALVTGLLVGVYAGLVLLATQVLGFASTWAVAASTLAAAALFAPVRRRVQRVVDRRFNRARYDSDTIVAAFSDRLKDAVDLAAVRADLINVSHQALEPVHVSVWISGGNR